MEHCLCSLNFKLYLDLTRRSKTCPVDQSQELCLVTAFNRNHGSHGLFTVLNNLSRGMIEFAAYGGRLGDRSPHDGWFPPSLVGAPLIASLCSSGFHLLTWVPARQIRSMKPLTRWEGWLCQSGTAVSVRREVRQD
jgi:hypothetical protein